MSFIAKEQKMELNELSIKLATFEAEGVSFESFLIASEDEQEVLQVIVDGNDAVSYTHLTLPTIYSV